MQDDGKLHFAPDLIVEVLSPGLANQRDREAKLKLYSRRAVLEYWLVDWSICSVEVYRRHNVHLDLFARLVKGDLLESAMLPGFSTQVDDLFIDFS